MSQAVISLSGGLDSAVLCAWLLADKEYQSIIPVFFSYGAKHNCEERKAAEQIAAYYQLSLQSIDLQAIFRASQSALMGHNRLPIPEEAYSSSSLKETEVPGRNLVFAASLASFAQAAKCRDILLAVHDGEHALYPDCRRTFIASLQETIQKSSDGQVFLKAPFVTWTKKEIVALGLRLQVPFGLTRSCYQDSRKSCGRCGTCRERLQAFQDNQCVDPASYE